MADSLTFDGVEFSAILGDIVGSYGASLVLLAVGVVFVVVFLWALKKR